MNDSKNIHATLYVPGLDEPITIDADDDLSINTAIQPQTGHIYLLIKDKTRPGWSQAYMNCAFSVTTQDSALYTPD